MTDKDKEIREQINRLTDTLVEDILQLSDEEVIAEAMEDFSNVDQVVSGMKALVQSSISKAGKKRMKSARASLASVGRDREQTLRSFSLEEKRSLLKVISTRQPITMAARNEKELDEADLDTMLQTLLNLGVIDEEGNIK